MKERSRRWEKAECCEKYARTQGKQKTIPGSSVKAIMSSEVEVLELWISMQSKANASILYQEQPHKHKQNQ